MRPPPVRTFYGDHDYPQFYFCAHGDSDRDKIMSMMRFIPLDERRAVSIEYSRIYLDDDGLEADEVRWQGAGRVAANEYLTELATKYRDELNGKQ